MTSITHRRSPAIWAASLLAIVFGLLSIKEGGSVLFGSAAARAAAGNYIPWVVWFNFLAGFAYVAAGAGLLMLRRWAAWLAIAIVLATLFASVGLGVNILSELPYEPRTVIAMGLRIVVWIVISVIAWRHLLRR